MYGLGEKWTGGDRVRLSVDGNVTGYCRLRYALRARFTGIPKLPSLSLQNYPTVTVIDSTIPRSLLNRLINGVSSGTQFDLILMR